jgi:hypothetical protein
MEALTGPTVFGVSEEQLSNFGMSFGIAAFMLYMLFIIGELAWKAKAGRAGTFTLFFVLAFGMVGFVAKAIFEVIWRI